MVEAPVTTTSPWLQRLRLLGAALLAGLLLSVPTGLLHRLYMRVSAVMGGEAVGFSWVGTIAIIVITAALVAPQSGLIYLLVRRLLPQSPVRAGLVSAALLMLVVGVPYLIAAPNGLNTTGDKQVNQVMYSTLFLFQGLAVVPVGRWFERRLPEGRQRPKGALFGYGVLSLFGVALLLLGSALMATEIFGN